MANAEAATLSPPTPATATSPGVLLVTLASTTADHVAMILNSLAQAFAGQSVLVVAPDLPPQDLSAFDESLGSSLTLLPPGDGPVASGSWLLTPTELLATFRQAANHGAAACLVLGPEAHSLRPSAMRALADSVLTGGADLGTPDYHLGPREGLFNSALLYPLSRALYNAQPRFPLALDLAISRRLADRLVAAATKASLIADGLLWPVAEAAVAGMRIEQVEVGPRALPAPSTGDLNTLLAQIGGSLFADIEAKAAFWQRSRPNQPALTGIEPDQGSDPADVQSLIEDFRVANTNLREIWSLVLPPQSLLGLKKLSLLDAPAFRMSAALWARMVYDFVLAFRLRTLNRGHLLGALTPLYLAWVASHLLVVESGTPPEQHIEETAAAFEAEKPYFVSRWRWPDRFNP